MCTSQLFCSNDLLRKIIGEGNSPKSLGKKMEFVFAFFGAKKIELRASFYSGEWQLPLPTPRSVGLARRKKHPGQFLRFRLNFNSYFFSFFKFLCSRTWGMFSSFVQLAISNAFYFKNYEITQNYEFT